MNQDDIVITHAKRTPIGDFLGSLANLSATELGSTAIKAVTEGLNVQTINAVFMGCVLPAGLGQAPARQAALGANLPLSVACTTVNKVCGSAMQAIIFAHDTLKAGSSEIIVAGGMESMSNAPYLSPKARQGYRMGHQQIYDHLFLDGLEDAYNKGQLMGQFAEQCASQYQFSRTQQDEFALESIRRARECSTWSEEICISGNNISVDDGPLAAKPEKIPNLKSAFAKDGTVTAANASRISDGAAACVLMSSKTAERSGLKPLARMVAHASHAHQSEWFTTAPISAIQKLLKKTNWSIKDVDLFEINEAFAVVAMAAMHELAIPHNKLNIHGGACVLGHPLGATGARIVVTLIHALRTHHLKRGIAALCIGGGEATAIAIEII